MFYAGTADALFSYQLIVIVSLGLVVFLLISILTTLLLCICISHKRRILRGMWHWVVVIIKNIIIFSCAHLHCSFIHIYTLKISHVPLYYSQSSTNDNIIILISLFLMNQVQLVTLSEQGHMHNLFSMKHIKDICCTLNYSNVCSRANAKHT